MAAHGIANAGELLLALVLCATLVAITATDLERRVIPNAVVGASAVAGIAIVLGFGLGELGERALATLAAGGGLLAIALAFPAGMGMGDVKLVGMLGIYLGDAIVAALLIAFALGTLVGALLIARHGPAARKRTIPFGPCLALGGVAGLLVGERSVEWYLNAIG